MAENARMRPVKNLGPLHQKLLDVSRLLHPENIRSIPWLAETMGVSSQYLYAQIKAGYLSGDRVTQLKMLLENAGYNLAELKANGEFDASDLRPEALIRKKFA